MTVTALAGGVGGSKLLVGLQDALPSGDLTAIVNTADDATMYGVHVSPDVDIVTYWLAGCADTDRGWGIKEDSFNFIAGLQRLDVDTWFGLGDRDLSTCVFRTTRLNDGATLTAVTDEIRRAFHVPSRILPMSDDPVRTRIVTEAGKTLEFQEYFVRERQEPSVREVRFAGIADAKPGPGVLDAIDAAETVILCPSNPVVSLAPILALAGVRDALRIHPHVVAVSPIVAGRALKGPAAKLLPTIGAEVSAAGVAKLYADLCDIFVVDRADEAELDLIAPPLRAIAEDTIMSDRGASERLARTLLSL